MSDFDPLLTISIKTNLFLETRLKNDFVGIVSLLINEKYIAFTNKKLKLGVFLFVCFHCHFWKLTVFMKIKSSSF